VGPAWDDDHPLDAGRLRSNARALVARLRADASQRDLPDLGLVPGWHRQLYAGCRVPMPGYVGHLRGDTSVPELTDYQVGTGPRRADGFPEKMGVWAAHVAGEVDGLLLRLCAAVTRLDAAIPVGQRPTTVDDLEVVVTLAAQLHGEWVRIHPFANGNGRTARTWVAWLMLRYQVPTFLTLKPRPSDVAYARAGRASMGRPPDFAGDHGETESVFSHLLTLALLP